VSPAGGAEGGAPSEKRGMMGTIDYSDWEPMAREVEAEEAAAFKAQCDAGVDADLARAAIQNVEAKRRAREQREERVAELEAEAAARTARQRSGGPGPHDAFVRRVLAASGPKRAPKTLAPRPKGAATGAAALALAEGARIDGNTAMALGQHRRAFWSYTDGVDAIKREADADGSQRTVRIALYGNRAQASLHLGFHGGAARDAATALAEDPANLKCWHRLAAASCAVGDADLALEACLRGLAVDASHRPLRKLEIKATRLKRELAEAAASAAAPSRAPTPPAAAAPAPPAPPTPPPAPPAAAPSPTSVDDDLSETEKLVAALALPRADAAPPPVEASA